MLIISTFTGIHLEHLFLFVFFLTLQEGGNAGFGGNRVRSPLRESGNTGLPRRQSRSRSRSYSPSHRRFAERRRDGRGGHRNEPPYRGGNRRRGYRPRGPRSRSRSPGGGGTGRPAGRLSGGSPTGLGVGGRLRMRRSRSRSWSPVRPRSAG